VKYRDDVPFMPRGLELDQAWFCGGRVGASLAKHGGLTSLVYFGRQPLGRAGFFQGDAVSAWTKVFRLCVMVDDVPYHPDFLRTELHPFGYRSEGSAGGVSFRHDLVLLNDALVQRVKILRNPRRATVALRLVWHGGPSRVGMDRRTWTTFAEVAKANVCAARAADDLPPAKPTPRAKRHIAQQESFEADAVRRGETHIAVGSDLRLTFRTMHDGFKHHADSAPVRDRAAFYVGFAGKRADLLKHMASLRASVHRSCDAKFAAAEAGARRRRQPSVRAGNRALESFLAQAPDVVVRHTGLVDGPSLFPDQPDLLGHDGNDLSVLNNSIYYQALRCTADLTPRRHHPAYAVLWVTPHAADLVTADLPRIAAFMARAFTNPRGIYNLPPADQGAFLSDGNQAQAYYPVVEPFYRNVMSRALKGKELAAWSDNVRWYWDRFTIPEGLTFDAVNASDLTPDCPGGKQPFAGKAWYELFFTAYAGVDVNVDGLALGPTPVETPIDICNLVLAGRRVDIRIRGRGTGAPRATLNGELVADPSRIPIEALGTGVNRLEVKRTARRGRARRSRSSGTASAAIAPRPHARSATAQRDDCARRSRP
jgi:hypothetical protein